MLYIVRIFGAIDVNIALNLENNNTFEFFNIQNIN